jgi:hypothetical protein
MACGPSIALVSRREYTREFFIRWGFNTHMRLLNNILVQFDVENREFPFLFSGFWGLFLIGSAGPYRQARLLRACSWVLHSCIALSVK